MDYCARGVVFCFFFMLQLNTQSCLLKPPNMTIIVKDKQMAANKRGVLFPSAVSRLDHAAVGWRKGHLFSRDVTVQLMALVHWNRH